MNDDGICEVELSGRLDIRVAPETREQLSQALGSAGSRLIVDLKSVDLIDSTILSVLQGTELKAREQGKEMVIVSPDGSAKKIFSLTGTNRFFDLCDSIEIARTK